MTPFALLPHPYTCGQGKGFAIQHQQKLPCRSESKGGRHIQSDLSYWFLDDNASRRPGRSSYRSISRASGGLLCRAWSLSSAACWRRKRGSLILALRWLLLHSQSAARHKTTDSHCLSYHHVVTLVRFSFRRVNRFDAYFLCYLSRSFRIEEGLGFYKGLGLNGGLGLNPLVSLLSGSKRYTFGKLVPYGRKFVQASVPWAEITGFAYRELWKEEIRVPNVDV